MWDGRGKGDLIPSLVSSFLPVLDLSFPSLVGPGQEIPPEVFLSRRPLGMAWLFLLYATWGDIVRGQVIFLPDTSSLT